MGLDRHVLDNRANVRFFIMHIVRIPFLTVRDNTMSGEKPLRTYVGPNYTGGVSDHCPVLLEVKKTAK